MTFQQPLSKTICQLARLKESVIRDRLDVSAGNQPLAISSSISSILNICIFTHFLIKRCVTGLTTLLHLFKQTLWLVLSVHFHTGKTCTISIGLFNLHMKYRKQMRHWIKYPLLQLLDKFLYFLFLIVLDLFDHDFNIWCIDVTIEFNWAKNLLYLLMGKLEVVAKHRQKAGILALHSHRELILVIAHMIIPNHMIILNRIKFILKHLHCR